MGPSGRDDMAAAMFLLLWWLGNGLNLVIQSLGLGVAQLGPRQVNRIIRTEQNSKKLVRDRTEQKFISIEQGFLISEQGDSSTFDGPRWRTSSFYDVKTTVQTLCLTLVHNYE